MRVYSESFSRRCQCQFPHSHTTPSRHAAVWLTSIGPIHFPVILNNLATGFTHNWSVFPLVGIQPVNPPTISEKQIGSTFHARGSRHRAAQGSGGGGGGNVCHIIEDTKPSNKQLPHLSGVYISVITFMIHDNFTVIIRSQKARRKHNFVSYW